MNYTRLLTPFGTLAESSQEYQYLTERHIQALWYEQKFIKSLQTHDGLLIEVLSPGAWNTEPGPDFLKAHLRIGGVEFKGDIEIDLRDSGWYSHRHSTNAAYDNVVLHIALWEPREKAPLTTSKGSNLTRVYLEHFLTVPQDQLHVKIDLDLYPYRTLKGTGKCGQKLFPKLSPEETEQFLSSAAEWRLVQKRRALSLKIDEPPLQFAAGIAMALGYKYNAEAFLQLFLRFHKLRHLPEQHLLALALGSCGFFADHHQERWGKNLYYQKLHTFFKDHHEEALNPIPLNLAQVRPLNHPVRRIAYLIKWLRDPKLESYYGKMVDLWASQWSRYYATGKWKYLIEELELLIPEYDDPHWFSHYTFEEKRASRLLPLIGSGFKQEMLINVMLPLLHQIATNAVEQKAFRAFYASLRATPKGKTQYLIHRFFGCGEPEKMLTRAIHEQGAYQLHRDFCTHFETSCEGCPFVERYEASFS